jgi:hypothetical protein
VKSYTTSPNPPRQSIFSSELPAHHAAMAPILNVG